VPKFKVGDRIRVTDPENDLGARLCDYTVLSIDTRDGTLDCGEASDGLPDQFVNPSEAILVPKPPVPTKSEAQARKDKPLYRGLLQYFPDSLMAVAELSRIANEQHNPGQPMHWAFGKSPDHLDCLLRHMADAGTLDSDGVLHDVKVAWRALAHLQTLLEKADPELHARRQAQRDRASKGE
jgi:hypothetical protein